MGHEESSDHEAYYAWHKKYPPVEQRLKTWTYVSPPEEVTYDFQPVTGYIEGALRQLRNDEKLRQVRELFQGVTEGFNSRISPLVDEFRKFSYVWTVLSKQQFTPAEFEKFWDGLKEPERVNYIRSLIG